jgi:hypothetical protein
VTACEDAREDGFEKRLLGDDGITDGTQGGAELSFRVTDLHT